MTSPRQSAQEFREQSSVVNEGLARASYYLGVLGGVDIGLGLGAEAYAVVADGPITGATGIFPIVWGAHSVYRNQKDMKREMGQALEDKAKASQPLETAAAATE